VKQRVGGGDSADGDEVEDETASELSNESDVDTNLVSDFELADEDAAEC
jgi:hypothetical protein